MVKVLEKKRGRIRERRQKNLQWKMFCMSTVWPICNNDNKPVARWVKLQWINLHTDRWASRLQFLTDKSIAQTPPLPMDRWPCSPSCCQLLSCALLLFVWLLPTSAFSQGHVSHFLHCSLKRKTARCPLMTREVAVADPALVASGSCWRDTWRRLSSAPCLGRCCCAGASCRSSGTACSWSPE